MDKAPIVACLANVLPGLAGRHQARTILDHQDSAEHSRRNRDALLLNSRPPSIPLCRCCMTEPNHDLVYSRHVLEHLIHLKFMNPDVNLDGHFLYIERTSIGCGETLTVGPIPPLHRPKV